MKLEGDAGKPRVFLATPAYDRTCAAYDTSLAESMVALVRAGIGGEHWSFNGFCHVDDGRNLLVRKFLDSDCTDLMFIDADMGWLPGDLVRLLGFDRDVVGGAYPRRKDGEPFVAYPEESEIRADDDGLVPVTAIGTGFLRIRRHVIEKMCARPQTQWFYHPGVEGKVPVLFERGLQGYGRMSGDKHFVREWRRMGGKAFIDPWLTLSHVGTVEYTGCIGRHWMRKAGLLPPDFINWMGELGKATADEPSADLEDIFAGLANAWDNGIFSMLPDGLYTAWHLAKGKQVILETGSGLTTLIMAVACSGNGGRVWALEHDVLWLRQTRAALEHLGITNVDLIHAPLVEHSDGSAWYDFPDDLPEQFDLVLMDGPQRIYGRGGLFSILGDRITGILLADDMNDPQEQDAVDKWAARNGREVHVMGHTKRFGIVRPSAVAMAAE